MWDDRRVIVVAGEATAPGTPDRCDLSLGLEVKSASAAEAIEQVTLVCDAAVAEIRAAGVPPSQIQTENLAVQQWFDHQQQRATAQVANYGLIVKGRAMGEVGPLLSALVRVAGDALRVNGINLTLSDPEPLRRIARERAVKNAQSKAAQLAEAAGVSLGPLLSIEEATVRPPGMATGTAMSGRGTAPPIMPIEPGSCTVFVSVTMTFEIGDIAGT